MPYNPITTPLEIKIGNNANKSSLERTKYLTIKYKSPNDSTINDPFNDVVNDVVK